MLNSDLFGQRNMTKLRIKTKLLVFFDLKDYKDILKKLCNQCNTVTCCYSLVPIHIELVSPLNEAIINKNIKTRGLGFNKDLDKVCVIGPCLIKSENYITFNSIGSFKIWFEHLLNQ